MGGFMRRGALAGVASLGAAFALALGAAADAKTDVAGTYEIATSDGLKGFLYVREDHVVRRRVFLPDKTIRTQVGRGAVEGDTLTVTFTGTGDPHDLAGDWSVTGDAERTGRYKGAAHFTKVEERWTTTFVPTDQDDQSPLPEVELAGTLAATVFSGERNGVAVVYSLSADGLTLSARAETFRRSALTANGGPQATYTFDSSGKVSGKLATGVTDKGARAVLKAASTLSTAELAKLPVEPDPVPNSLRATRETKILMGPTGPEGRAVKKDELVPVCGRQEGLWVVGPFKENGKKWKGFLKEEELNPRLHYAAVEAPIFLPGKRPSPASILQKDLGTCYFDAALMAISEHQPRVIETMVRDLKDGTVAVRFFVKDEHGRYAEQWVRVNRTIVVDEKGRSHYTAGEGGQLWPALVEKAFAAWRGKGYYRNIEGGLANDVFEVVLGRAARLKTWVLPLPGEIGTNRMRAEIPQLSKADRDAMSAFSRTTYWKTEGAELVNHPSRRRDFAYVEKLLGKVDELSTEGERLLKSYYKPRCEGPLGSGKYSAQAKEIYQLIDTTDRAKRPMCLGTKAWGKGGTGQSAGENIEVVPGLASTHEYMVLGCRTDEKKLSWVKVQNPWHHFSRRYERDKAGELVATAVDGKKDEGHGLFEVELSDVMRYFGTMSYVAD